MAIKKEVHSVCMLNGSGEELKVGSTVYRQVRNSYYRDSFKAGEDPFKVMVNSGKVVSIDTTARVVLVRWDHSSQEQKFTSLQGTSQLSKTGELLNFSDAKKGAIDFFKLKSEDCSSAAMRYTEDAKKERVLERWYASLSKKTQAMKEPK